MCVCLDVCVCLYMCVLVVECLSKCRFTRNEIRDRIGKAKHQRMAFRWKECLSAEAKHKWYGEMEGFCILRPCFFVFLLAIVVMKQSRKLGFCNALSKNIELSSWTRTSSSGMMTIFVCQECLRKLMSSSLLSLTWTGVFLQQRKSLGLHEDDE